MRTKALKTYLKFVDDKFDLIQIVGAKEISYDGADIAYVFDDEKRNVIFNAAINRIPLDDGTISLIYEKIFLYAVTEIEDRGEVEDDSKNKG